MKDLETRMLEFSVSVVKITHNLNSEIGRILAKQLVRSGTSCTFNYGEAKSAESRKDFIHKMSISLKELRETHLNLRVIEKANLLLNETELKPLIQENHELISIFVKSIVTSKKRLNNSN